MLMTKRVVRHKRGWAVEHISGSPLVTKTVVGVYRTKAEAEAHINGTKKPKA